MLPTGQYVEGWADTFDKDVVWEAHGEVSEAIGPTKGTEDENQRGTEVEAPVPQEFVYETEPEEEENIEVTGNGLAKEAIDKASNVGKPEEEVYQANRDHGVEEAIWDNRRDEDAIKKAQKRVVCQPEGRLGYEDETSCLENDVTQFSDNTLRYNKGNRDMGFDLDHEANLPDSDYSDRMYYSTDQADLFIWATERKIFTKMQGGPPVEGTFYDIDGELRFDFTDKGWRRHVWENLERLNYTATERVYCWVGTRYQNEGMDDRLVDPSVADFIRHSWEAWMEGWRLWRNEWPFGGSLVPRGEKDPNEEMKGKGKARAADG
ncbi:MAG: hypothetical protein Q9186_004309 [Xanthomendoza sp. 1 TL-2023]